MKYCDACHTTYPNEFQTCPKDQSVLRAISELRQGMVIRDKYQIMEKIGAGGMAVVYKARHLAFNELRAIKVVNSRLLDDDAFIRRFKSEAIITRKLMHPNAVRVDDLDSTEDGRPFMVMEYVHGKDLRHLIQREGPLPVRRALNIARQACSALSAAHDLGITHRDIKPDNILITDPGDGSDVVKVLDFGIAKIREAGMDAQHSSTKTGMVVGTPQYISPEQAMGRHGEQIDGRADLYSLGVVLYEMVTGRLPFESDTPMGLLLHHIQSIAPVAHELAPELRIPETLSLLLVRALEKDRMLRFQSAAEMMTALDAVDDELRTGVTYVATRPNLQAVAGAAVQRQRTPTPMPRVPTPAPPQRYQPATPPYQSTPPRGQTAAAARSYAPPPRSSSNTMVYVISAVVLLALVGGIYYYLRPAQSSAQASDTRTYASPDDKLVADVRGALANSSDIKSNIDVSAQNGVVTLKGKVGSLYEQQMAESLAKGVAGVKDVVDQTDYQKVSPVVDIAATPTPAPEQPRSKPQAQERPPQERGPSAADKAKARSLVTEGNSEADNGEYNAAIASYQQALELDPKNSDARTGLAKAQKAKATEDEIMRRR